MSKSISRVWRILNGGGERKQNAEISQGKIARDDCLPLHRTSVVQGLEVICVACVKREHGPK